jgi:predicted P-loop ATPase
MQNKQILSECIHWYAENGYTLFSLNGKRPTVKFGVAPFNPFPMPEDFPYGNLGVKLTDEDLVIDIDPRNFPQGVSPLEAFQELIDFHLKNSTYIVKTGGGGLHLYFKKPKDFPIRGALKEFPGLEFKTRGQYVVGAGSTHPDTKKPYLVVHNAAISQAPVRLLDLLRKLEVSPDPGLTHYVDDQQTKDRFVQYLKTAPLAVEGESGDKTTFAVAAVGHDFGLSPDVAFDLMCEFYNPQCMPPWEVGDLRKKVYNAYNYSAGNLGAASVVDKFDKVEPIGITIADLRADQHGKILKSVYNTVVVFNLDLADTLALNVWNDDIIFTKPAPWHKENERVTCWTDEETARAKYYFSKERKFEPNSQMIEDAIITVARQKPFHPIKDYLERTEWDGFERLKNWLSSYMGVEDNIYIRAVGLKMLVAAVTRIYRPGYKFDYIPVIEGAQGIGKSRAVAILGGEWYGDITIDVHAKDTVDVMRRLWIIEISEMETQYRTETQALKSFLSRSSDICRLAYGRRSKVFPRQNIFIGTINPEFDEDAGWLKDTTGNRRYWPVVCKRIDIDALRKVRDQLWAEALLYYKNNTTLHFEDTEIEEHALDEQKKRMGRDPWFDKISRWVKNDINKEKNVFTGAEIYCDCLGGKAIQYSRGCQNRISIIMRILEWKKGVYYHRDTKEAIRGYQRPGVYPGTEVEG